MKVTYSLREFYDGAKELAAMDEKTQNYFTVSAEMGFHKDDVRFRLYIHEFGSEQGKTPLDCLEQMRNRMFPVVKDESEKDVVVETETEATEDELL